MKNNGNFINCVLRLLGAMGLVCFTVVVHSGELPKMPDEAIKAIAHVNADKDRMVVLSRLLKRHVHQTKKIVDELDATERLPAETRQAAWQERKTLVASKRHELKALRKETLSEMAAVRNRLVDAGLTKEAQHWADKLARVEKRFGELEDNLGAVEKAKYGQHAGHKNKLKDHVAKLLADERAQELPGPPPEPGDNRPRRRLPVKQPVSNVLPRYMADAGSDAGRAFAALQSGRTALAAPPALPADASTCGNTAADLAETLEVKLTPEITSLAEQLGYSPARIYKYVHDNIRFEPYYGSLKGSQATYISQAGGSTDQASLLIALLRASNIPARYVKGTAIIRRANNWLGVDSTEAAVAVLQYGLNPSAYKLGTAADGNLYISMTHVWVEACVPYANYRGTQDDSTGFRWIPLDASFKSNVLSPGYTPPSVAFDYTGYMAGRLYEGRNLMPLERYAQQVEAAIKPLDANATLAYLDMPPSINPLALDVLPTTLPYDVFEVLSWDTGLSAETAALPAVHRFRVDLKLKNSGGTTLLATTYPIAQIALQRVTLGYKGATPALEATINSWKNDGNLNNAVPCGLSVVPELKFEGVSQVVGTTGVDYCATTNGLTISIIHPDDGRAPWDFYTFGSKAAELIALQTYAFQASDKWLETRSARLLNTLKTVPNPNSNQDETLGEFLNIASLKYYRYADDDSRRIAALSGTFAVPWIAYGRTSSQSKVQYLFDVPYGVYRTGFLVDALGGAVLLSKSTGIIDYAIRLFQIYQGSYRESYLWMENAHLDAVSTVRGLQFAAEKGIQILTLNSANWAANVGLFTTNSNAALNLSAANIAGMKTIVDGGGKVTTPRSLIQYESWKGVVYMGEEADGTLIAAIGEANGGYSVEELSFNFDSFYNEIITFDPILDYVSPLASPNSSEPVVLGQGAICNGESPYNTIPAGTSPTCHVNMVTGNEYHAETDFSIKSRGLNLSFKRHYNSRQPPSGWQVAPLGYGWNHTYNQYLTFKDSNFDATNNATDTDNITSSVIWSDGSGADRFIPLTGASAGGVAVGATFTTPKGFYFTVAKLADSSYTVTEKNGTVYSFQSQAGTVNQVARLTSIRDRNNNTIVLTYSGNNLMSVADGLAANRKLDFTYDGLGRITQVADWTGRAYKYEYDAAGNLATVSNPLAIGGSQPPIKYTYYSGGTVDHALKSITYPRGNSMTFEYYANGKMFREYDSLGQTNFFNYNEMRRESSFVNKRGYTLRYFFNADGNPVQLDDEVRGQTFNTYDTTNPYLKLSERNPLGYVSAYTYDANGNVTQVTLPSQATVAYSNYNAFGSPGKVKDTRGNYTILKYDARGNVLDAMVLRTGVGAAVSDSQSYTPLPSDLVSRTINTFDANGNLLTTKRVRDFASNAGPTLTYGYTDAANGVNGLNLTTITRSGDSDGNVGTVETNVANLTYDSLGRLITGINGKWYDTFAQYDALDRVITFKDSVGKLRSNSYDPNGNLVKTWLVNGSAADMLAINYDLADRKETVVSNGGGVTAYQYDAASNVTKVTNPDQYTLGVDYDGANRAFRAFDQVGNQVLTVTDQLGKPLTILDPNGNAVERGYYDGSKEGRLKTSTDAIGRTTTQDYDAAGNVTSVTDNAGGVTFTTYDELNRPVRVVGPVLTGAGNVRPVKVVSYTPLGYVSTVKIGQTDASGSNIASDTVAWQSNYTWDDYGHKLSETDGLGKTRTFTYDLFGNVLSTTTP